MQLIGTIYGEVKPTEFEILLINPNIERGSYVKIDHEQYGWVLSKIDTIRRYISAEDQEITLAKAHAIAYKGEKSILVPKIPFKPEERVYLGDRKLIRQILGLKKSKTNNIYLGLLEGHNLTVYLDVHKTINKHISVLAKTGAGKSYTVAVLLEELLDKGIPIIIIDPHGEYSSLNYENDDLESMEKYEIKPKTYANKVTEYSPDIVVNPDAKKLAIQPRFTLYELIEIMPMRLNDVQKSIVYDSLKRLEGKEYSIQDLINVVRMDDRRTKWKVINGLETLRDSGIFEGKAVTEEELVKKGHASIINLKGLEPKIQQLVVTKIARDLFEAKKLNKIPNLFFLIEEAHNFCPERGFGEAMSSNILRTVASEGRKFGFHLGVVSQRPARVDKNVLSQCNTQIILKITNPNDLRAIGQSIEGFTPGMENDIRQLSVGHALVVGECVEQPITVDIRTRKSRHYDAARFTPKKELEPGMIDKIKPIFLKEEVKPTKKSYWDKIKSIFLKET